MHDAPANSHAGQRTPFKQEGWGVAAFIVLLALATAGAATYVHKTTHKDPTDVRFHAAGTSNDAAH